MGVTNSISEIKSVANYPAHIIQRDLQRFIVKNIRGKSMEANDLSHILKKWVCCILGKSKLMLPIFFSKLKTLQEAFETTAQINEELKIMELDGAFCHNIKLLIDRFS